MTPIAQIISVMDSPKYSGEKIITVFCPYCREAHKHRGDAQNTRQARCDNTKEYEVKVWPPLPPVYR